jgi:hypothetical protein
LMWTRTVNTWTRRSTEAWSGHSSTWWRCGWTSNSRYVCALVFKHLCGLRIDKQSSAYSDICDILPTFAFGTPRLLLWLYMDFQKRYFAGCRLDRKSTSRTCQFLGSSLVSWSSRKQSSVAQFTTEAEYVVAASCCSQLLWITYKMSDLVRSIPMSQCHKHCKESSTSFQNQAHRSEVSFPERQRRERGNRLDPCTHTWLASRYFQQTPRSSNFHSFARGAWCLFDFLSRVCGSSFVAYV